VTAVSSDVGALPPEAGATGRASGHVPGAHPGVTMLTPDFPFPYDEWLASPAGLGAVPEERHGTEVGVVGAGISGLVAAYELMRLGLRPVVYEADQVGGRLRSVPIPGVEDVVADLGGMRFPPSGRAWSHYADLAGVRTAPFPNPLSPASPSTVIDLGGQVHYARGLADLPPLFAEVATAWERALGDIGVEELRDAVAARDLPRIKALWSPLVAALDETSFYGFVAASSGFRDLPYGHRETFGQVGFGTGGWDTDFPNSILEILRVVATDADSGHRRVLGGAQQVPLRLWRRAPGPGESLVHWPAGTSLASLHGGAPRPGVSALRRAPASAQHPDGGVVITDRWGGERTVAAAVVTCQSWLLSASITTEEALFDHATWMAMDRSHYAQSSKTFVMVDRPFWRDVDPATGRHVMSTTLTDRMTRATYLLEEVDEDGEVRLDAPALICLSYTWNDDALKWLALSTEDRVRRMLASLGEVYPGLDIAGHIVGEPVTVSWESDPHFMGAFRGALPGHYRYQRRLFSHFVQHDLPPEQRGIFLAGDDISFTPGWADGAVTTGLNAVWGVVHHLGGASDPANPGPGDRFAELAPVDLDAPASTAADAEAEAAGGSPLGSATLPDAALADAPVHDGAARPATAPGTGR
jgi:tryptophan 2-monooxygenase